MFDIHELKPSEETAFISLWSETFGDSREDIIEFCKIFSDDLIRFALTDVEFGNVVLSSLTLFKMGKLFIPGAQEDFNLYISYAICTKPDARGRGYGAAITRFASEYVKKMNLRSPSTTNLSALSPASESLIDFYNPLGYDNFFFSEYKALDSVKRLTENINISVISPEEYNKKRERILENIVHISLSENSLKYLSSYNTFISFNDDSLNLNGISTFSPISKGDELMISELLLSNNGSMSLSIPLSDYENAASAISLKLGASHAKYRFPSSSSNSIVQGMLYEGSKISSIVNNTLPGIKPYLGFPFD